MDETAASTLFACLDREVWLMTACAGERRGGLIATFVNPASIVVEMPRMLVGLSRQHYTWELVQASRAFALHLLAEQHLELVWRFGLKSGRTGDKFEGMTVSTGATGSPVLTDCIGWLDCRVEARMDSGDRTVYLAEVVGAQVTQFGPPLTAKRLMDLAPPQYLSELKRQRADDSHLDADAIADWRARLQTM
jgi:flavin reductase (DIM6/NTAB) family NADH-FMN oxidoreductase RutF